MYISADTIDDVLRVVISRLLKIKTGIRTSRGETREIFGVLLQLVNPRARLSRTERKGTIFSCLGELLWYLAKSDELAFINYYAPEYRKDSDDEQTIHGAYGPRLFGKGEKDQFANVLRLLTAKPNSRRAVIQLFEPADIAEHHTAVPCTCTLQFVIRHGRLDMLTSMRSNDAFLGLPHDVFTFTMLQEIMARELKLELGTYKHIVGSIHLYETDVKAARTYLREKWQQDVPMPPMPSGTPWYSIRKLLHAEKEIRGGRAVDVAKLELDPYWEDLVRLLEVYRHFKSNERYKIAAIKNIMSCHGYDPYIEKKIQTAPKPVVELPKPAQLSWL
jgi:thymidylate synthase